MRLEAGLLVALAQDLVAPGLAADHCSSVDSREARIRAVDANEFFEEGDGVVAQRIYPLEDPLPELLH